MKYDDLRDFIAQLEKLGELKRVAVEVDPVLEMTEICDRVLRQGGPAILFEKVRGHSMPVLGNLFGTPRRVALGMGQESLAALREVGRTLAYLKEPEPPKGLKDAWDKLPIFKQVLNMSPKTVSSAPCQQVVKEGRDVDLASLPIQHCWPGDVAPLITWGLVVTKGPHKNRQNLGIVRPDENALWSLGPHDISVMLWLVGERPVEAAASGESALRGIVADRPAPGFGLPCASECSSSSRPSTCGSSTTPIARSS